MKALHTLLSALPEFTMSGDRYALSRAITSIEYDSRRCREDSLFVAICGTQADGHDFIPEAVKRGARCIIAEREIDMPDNTITVVLVPNARKALALLSHQWFDEPSRKLPIYGVTGTNGKTTTTFMLKSLLEERGETVGIIGTTGNYIGNDILPASFTTPEAPELCALFVEMRKRGASAIVMEVSSHALALERVYATQFAGAVFTNLTQDHLDFHGTMEQYAAAKQKLFAMLPENALIVANAGDAWCNVMLAHTRVPARNRWYYSRSARSKEIDTDAGFIRIADVRLGLAQTEFSLVVEDGKGGVQPYHFSMSPIGNFNVENATGCLAMMSLLGASWEELTQYMPSVQGAPGRMQRVILSGQPLGGNGMQGDMPESIAIVDYAHTPDALEKALLSCRELRDMNFPEGRVVCVFGCGGNRDRTKRPKMGEIAALLADRIYPTSDNPRNEDPLEILDDILEGIPKEKFIVTTVLPDRREAIERAVREARAGDIILIAGKGHEHYQIIGNERIRFDDVEVVREVLSE